MSESTRPQGAPGCGGGGVGEGPLPPSTGVSPGRRREHGVEMLLRSDGGDLDGAALGLDGEPGVPHGLLLLCGAPGAECEAAARAVARQVWRGAVLPASTTPPEHAAVVAPVPGPSAWEHALRVAAEEAPRQGCLVLARPPVTGPRGLRASYLRAVADACLAAAAAPSAGAVVLPGDLVIPRMLAGLDDDDRRALLAPIQPILCLPPAHRSAYLRTLDALRRCGGTQAGAAAELHLHVNSVRYRMDRIEEMTGRRLGDPADRMAVDLAVLLVLLRSTPLGGGRETWAEGEREAGPGEAVELYRRLLQHREAWDARAAQAPQVAEPDWDRDTLVFDDAEMRLHHWAA